METSTNGRGARFKIEETTTAHVIIRDLGPWDRHLSVTNDAERVVESLAAQLGSRRLYYYDSSGELDELKVVGGQFAGFAPGGVSTAENVALLEGLGQQLMAASSMLALPKGRGKA